MRKYVKLMEFPDRVVCVEAVRYGDGWQLELTLESGHEMTDDQQREFVDLVLNDILSAGGVKQWANV